MSDQGQVVERWEAPFFEQPAEQANNKNPVEIEKLAQARGFQLGKWEGLESGRLEAEQQVKQMKSIVEEMAQPFRSLDQLVAKELAEVAMVIARQILRSELKVSSDVVTKIASEAMTMLSSIESEITIFLNPVDISTVKELMLESQDGKNWKLVEDFEMLPGGCRVKTPMSYVDASIEKQMEQVFATLLESSENSQDL